MIHLFHINSLVLSITPEELIPTLLLELNNSYNPDNLEWLMD